MSRKSLSITLVILLSAMPGAVVSAQTATIPIEMEPMTVPVPSTLSVPTPTKSEAPNHLAPKAAATKSDQRTAIYTSGKDSQANLAGAMDRKKVSEKKSAGNGSAIVSPDKSGAAPVNSMAMTPSHSPMIMAPPAPAAKLAMPAVPAPMALPSLEMSGDGVGQ